MTLNKDKIKIGIIGAGNIAKAHLIAANNVDSIHVIGVYDNDHSRAQDFHHSIPTYADADQLIDAVDAIIIATPNHTHTDYVMRALKKAKHILCEKPLATSDIEAEHMYVIALESEVVCNVGFNYRFLEVFQILKKLLGGHEFGDVLSIDMEFKKSSALLRKKYTWRDSVESCNTSGALGDLGIHLIDLLRFLFITKIDTDHSVAKIATYVPQKENTPVHVDDYALINGLLENNIYFRILTSKVALPEEVGFSVKVIGTKKEFLYNSNMRNEYKLKEAITWETKAFKPPILPDPPTEFTGWAQSFVTQLENWTQAILHKKSPSNATFCDGYQAQKILTHFLQLQHTTK